MGNFGESLHELASVVPPVIESLSKRGDDPTHAVLRREYLRETLNRHGPVPRRVHKGEQREILGGATLDRRCSEYENGRAGTAHVTQPRFERGRSARAMRLVHDHQPPRLVTDRCPE